MTTDPRSLEALLDEWRRNADVLTRASKSPKEDDIAQNRMAEAADTLRFCAWQLEERLREALTPAMIEPIRRHPQWLTHGAQCDG